MKKGQAVGVLLLALAAVSWLAIVAVPFLPLSLAQKAGAVAGLVVLGEVWFWLGTLVLGKEVVQRFLKRSKGEV